MNGRNKKYILLTSRLFVNIILRPLKDEKALTKNRSASILLASGPSPELKSAASIKHKIVSLP